MFTHLHIRSCYTLLQSTLTISKIIDSCKQHGFKSAALTDYHVMHGAIAFYHACKKEGIHPILGMEVDTLWNDEVFGFVLLAKNDLGYQQLLHLSTLLSTKDCKLLQMDQVANICKDCVVLTAGKQDELEIIIVNEDEERLENYLSKCKNIFNDFYVSIARNDSGLLFRKNVFLKNIAKKLNIKTTALSRIYFQDQNEEESYKTLCAIRQGVHVDDKVLNYSPKRYFRSKMEMEAIYDQDDLLTTNEISKKCNVEMKYQKATLPQFENKLHIPSDVYLRKLCMKGLEKRMEFKEIPEIYKKRLTYELDVIISMHYADYFLIVWDFIRFAKTKKIYIGPGRGSAAGSLVAYCLGITHVDPIKYDLLFERFLNPERISLPDIDTDFPDNRRDEVIEYVKETYGEQRVAHIITFNTLAAKQVLRDVARAMNINLRDVDMLCRMVPNVLKVTLDYAYDNSPGFKQMINSSEKYRKLFHIAKRLEGLPRHASLHAAGIILSNQPIEFVCPLIDVDEGVAATQFTMEYLEDLGLIKMDFLGLRNLTIIDEIVNNIRMDKGKEINIMKIPLNDERTYQLIRNVDTMGVFQLESEGMKNLLRKMQPKTFEDIVATIALFRPGPMENIPAYLEAREHPDKIKYPHPSLEPILKKTYGIMIYQEQIQQVAQLMAGFSLGKADILRRAISKKHGDELIQLRQDFIDGTMKKGFPKKLGEEIYELIMKFANYGFNRSHSVAYGMLAYQMAYLKANAPLYFFAALLNSVIGAESKTSEYIFEARRRGIEILSPSVNLSKSAYQIEGTALRFPLLAIKGIGKNICEAITLERELHGKFNDFYDFTARIMTRKVNKKIIESLIHAGALDEFKMNRASMLASLDDALRYGDLVKIEDVNQITIDFDLVSKPIPVTVKENAKLKSEKEREVLGFYLSKHPIAQFRSQFDPSLVNFMMLKNKREYVRFICYIERCKQHRTKNGDLMMFLLVSDESMKFDLVIMPNLYNQYQDVLLKGNYLYVEGKIDKENSCLVKKLRKLEL